MSDTVQQLITRQIWDTTSVEEGAVRVEKAFERQQRALESTSKAVDLYNRAMAQTSAAKGKSGGGHGGGGGENLTWAFHDIAEGRGTQGLFRLASAFGMVGGAATAAFAALKLFNSAREADNQLVESSLSLEKAMGEGRKSSFQRNDLYYGLRFLPRSMFDLGEGGQSQKESIAGIAQQREEIAAEIEKAQASRGYLASTWSYYTWPLTGHNHMDENIDAEGRAHDKLFELDARGAGVINRQTAAQRLGAFGSERQGKLAESGLESEQERAQIIDQYNAGKIGLAERSARMTQARGGQKIRDRTINLGYDAEERERNHQGADIYTRGRGYHVAEGLARNRMDAAQLDVQAAPTDEARAAARTKYVSAWFDENQANKARREREAGLEAQQKIADFRGSSDARALQSAEQELELQKGLLSIAKERGADAEKAANVAVAAAQKTLDLLKEQQAVARIGYENQLGKDSRDVVAGRALLRGASPEAAEREQLAARVKDAEDDHRAAHAEAREKHFDVASKAKAAAARRAVQEAQTALDIHDQQFTRDRGRQMVGAQGETAALRYGVAGRGDLARLTSDRTQSSLAIDDANFHQNPALASELGEQQQLRERQMLVGKYLNQDGTRRNPADVQAEEVANRRKAMRINQFFGTTPEADVKGGLESGSGIETAAARRLGSLDLAHDPAARLAAARGPKFGGTALSGGATKVGMEGLGIVGVHRGADGSIIDARDALTGEHMNGQQIAKRSADAQAHAAMHADNARDDRSDREIQQEIYKLLNTRLPATTK